MIDVSAPAPLKVVSLRTDGLGQRLMHILQAMVLARNLGVDYGFTWGYAGAWAHHAMLPASELFTPQFMADHVLEEAPEGFVDIDQAFSSRDHMVAALGDGRGWAIRSTTAFRRLAPGLKHAAKGQYAALFSELEFNDDICEAMSAARAVELPEGAVALHLRAGDIIYGRYRFRDRFTRKVIALPVARWLIRRWTEAGRTVVLFGQDPLVIDQFRGRDNVIIAGDLSGAFETPIHRAMFEITLMSRCGAIHAGFSAFAHLAARLADVKVRAPKDSATTEQQIAIIRADLADQDRMATDPPLQIAFAAWRGAQILEVDDIAGAVPLLETAIRHDPINGFYRLKLIGFLYELNRDEEADAAVADLVDEHRNPGAPKAVSIARGLLNESSGGVQRERDALLAAVARGVAQADHLTALLSNKKTRPAPRVDAAAEG